MRAALSSLAALGAVIAAGACSKADDAPGPVATCQILWATMGSSADRYDVYIIEMPREDWVPASSRTFSFEDGIYGIVYDEFEQSTGDYFQRAAANAGSFLLTTSQAVPVDGGVIGVSDSDVQQYFGVGGDDELTAEVLASGGIGAFVGEWSPADDPQPGAGSVSISFVGDTSGALSLGDYVRYAQCFDSDSGSSISSGISSRRWPIPRFPRP